jgi:hypothetical protein
MEFWFVALFCILRRSISWCSSWLMSHTPHHTLKVRHSSEHYVGAYKYDEARRPFFLISEAGWRVLSPLECHSTFHNLVKIDSFLFSRKQSRIRKQHNKKHRTRRTMARLTNITAILFLLTSAATAFVPQSKPAFVPRQSTELEAAPTMVIYWSIKVRIEYVWPSHGDAFLYKNILCWLTQLRSSYY